MGPGTRNTPLRGTVGLDWPQGPDGSALTGRTGGSAPACPLSRGNPHSFLHGQQCRVCTRGPRALTDEVGGVGGTEEVRQVQPPDQGRVHGDSAAPAPRVVCGKRVHVTHHPNPSPASPGVAWTPTPTRSLQSTQDQRAQFSRTWAPVAGEGCMGRWAGHGLTCGPQSAWTRMRLHCAPVRTAKIKPCGCQVLAWR